MKSDGKVFSTVGLTFKKSKSSIVTHTERRLDVFSYESSFCLWELSLRISLLCCDCALLIFILFVHSKTVSLRQLGVAVPYNSIEACDHGVWKILLNVYSMFRRR